MFTSTLRHILRGFPRPKHAARAGQPGGFTLGQRRTEFGSPEGQRLPGRHRVRS